MTIANLFQIDAFTDQAFRGNPAAVCLLETDRDATWMQSVAAEMNLSETAFVRPDNGHFGLRWFTPKVEVDLCGHATLASAHALWSSGIVAGGAVIRFDTRSGALVCSRNGELIDMEFPASQVKQCEPDEELLAALGATASFAGQSGSNRLVVIESPAALRSLEPDFARLRQLPIHGVIVTSPSDDPEFDFLSRFFAPGVGIDEDPVTGSAHCCLGPFWSKRLGKISLKAYQASARGGIVHLRLAGDRIMLGGRARTVLEGTLLA